MRIITREKENTLGRMVNPRRQAKGTREKKQGKPKGGSTVIQEEER